MVQPVSNKPSQAIQQERSEQNGQLNGRQVSQFVAGANDEFQTYLKATKAAAILTMFVPLIALAGGYPWTAAVLFGTGGLATLYTLTLTYAKA